MFETTKHIVIYHENIFCITNSMDISENSFCVIKKVIATLETNFQVHFYFILQTTWSLKHPLILVLGQSWFMLKYHFYFYIFIQKNYIYKTFIIKILGIFFNALILLLQLGDKRKCFFSGNPDNFLYASVR